MKHLIYLLILACLISCTPKQEVVEEEEEMDEDEIYEAYFSLERAKADEVPTDTALFMSFDKKGAIPVYPDTAWINEQLKTTDEETMSTIMDDYSFYEADAIDTLQSRGVNVYEAAGKRYYKFKVSNGDFVVDLFKVRGEFGVILYNGKDIPTFVAPMEVADVMDSLVIN